MNPSCFPIRYFCFISYQMKYSTHASDGVVLVYLTSSECVHVKEAELTSYQFKTNAETETGELAP